MRCRQWHEGDAVSHTRVQVMDYLKNVPAFRSFSRTQLEGVALKLKKFKYAEGDVIMTKGDAASAFYMIKAGEVSLTVGAEAHRNAARIEGEYFGEVGLLKEDHMCEFTATAKTVCRVARAIHVSTRMPVPT